MLAAIPTLSTDDIHRVLEAMKDEIAVRENNLAALVDYVPDFCQDDALMERVKAECDALDLHTGRRKAVTHWLSPKSDPYIYPDSNPIHTAKDISTSPAVEELLSHINASSEVTGPLDSCLIIKYNTNNASLSLHADDEPIFDHSKAICSFTLGAPRTVEFFSKARKPQRIAGIDTRNNGLLVMRPGTQDRLKHCVRAVPGLDNTTSNQVRYSLSFRALASHPPISSTAPVPPATVSPKSQPPPAENCETPLKPTYRKICLLAGDSFAERLDAQKLGKNRCTVMNIAKGGSKIKAVINQLTDFFSSNPDVIVEKLIVSVGTNDLRNCSDGFNHLKGPFKQLCSKINELCPNSKVFFQSLLPLPVKFGYDFQTNAKMCEFNVFIYDNCCYNRYYYIDAYIPFSKPRRWGQPDTRIDRLFESKYGIHPCKGRGMGTLARLYMRALYSRFFEPRVFQ